MPSLYVKLDTLRGEFTAKIGESQFKILDTIQITEGKLFYIDQSARYASYLTLNKLEKQGGYYNAFPCGQIEGYTLWKNEENSCFPRTDDVLLTFQTAITPYLNSFMEKNGLIEDNYDYFIKIEEWKFRLVGTALKNLVSKVILKGKQIGKYSIKPSFDVMINYDLKMYTELNNLFIGYDGLFNKIADCEKEKELNICVIGAFAESNLENSVQLQVDKKIGRTFLISAIDKDKKYLVPNDFGFVDTPQNIKFAVYFPILPPETIRELQAINPAGSDKQILLKWKEDQKIVSYKIASEFGEIILNTNDTERYTPIDCTFEVLGGECEPAMEEETLYKDSRGYLYLMVDNLDEKEYEFVVTATNLAGDEVHAILTATVMDKLAPGKISNLDYNFSHNRVYLIDPVENIDGSDLYDGLEYYYFLNEDSCDGIIPVDGIEISLENRKTEEDINLIFSLSQSGMKYCLAAVAADNNWNPVALESNEDKTNSLKLKAEYSKIFSQLYTTAIITIP